MTSRLDATFIKQFRRLPDHVQRLARVNYQLWLADPGHPSLEFKRVNVKLPIYSVRIGIHHRAVGVRRNDQTMLWFFIGSHADYDALLKRL